MDKILCLAAGNNNAEYRYDTFVVAVRGCGRGPECGLSTDWLDPDIAHAPIKLGVCVQAKCIAGKFAAKQTCIHVK